MQEKLQSSIDRGFFYVWASKVGAVLLEESLVCVATTSPFGLSSVAGTGEATLSATDFWTGFWTLFWGSYPGLDFSSQRLQARELPTTH